LRRTVYRISPTFILVTINVAVYLYTSLIGSNFLYTTDYVLRIYGQSASAILQNGRYWQLITSMFVHVNIAHVASNMFFLLIFGLRAEDFFTDAEYYLVYCASGFAGNLLSLLYTFYPHNVTSAGASGAIFGLFGAVIIYLRKVVERSIVGALIFAFMFFLITISASTNIYAHFGGLVAGLLIGYWLAHKRQISINY
jgi:rhomboid protease GluP